MPTIGQLIKYGRHKAAKKNRVRALNGNPQVRGIVTRIAIRKPKKPNSAQRRVLTVRLVSGITVLVYDPGEGSRIQEHANVLIKGGRVKDLPGVKFHVIRGALDSSPAIGPTPKVQGAPHYRRQKRSKYGVNSKKIAS